MNNAVLTQALLVGTVSVLAAAGAATWWGSRAALGVLAGGLWNLASLWSLGHLLAAWLGQAPSAEARPRGTGQRRAIGWLLLKFPLLYTLVFLLVRCPALSLAGFGVGFTVTLVAVAAMLWRPVCARQEQADG